MHPARRAPEAPPPPPLIPGLSPGCSPPAPPPTPHAPARFPSEALHLPGSRTRPGKITPCNPARTAATAAEPPKSRPSPPPRLIVPGWPQAAEPRGWPVNGDPRHRAAHAHQRLRRGGGRAAEAPWRRPGRGRRLQVGGSRPGSVSRRLARSRLAGGWAPRHPRPAAPRLRWAGEARHFLRGSAARARGVAVATGSRAPGAGDTPGALAEGAAWPALLGARDRRSHAPQACPGPHLRAFGEIGVCARQSGQPLSRQLQLRARSRSWARRLTTLARPPRALRSAARAHPSLPSGEEGLGRLQPRAPPPGVCCLGPCSRLRLSGKGAAPPAFASVSFESRGADGEGSRMLLLISSHD